MATAVSKEAKQLEQIKNTFDKAYKEMGKASEADIEIASDTDIVKFSLKNNNITKNTKISYVEKNT